LIAYLFPGQGSQKAGMGRDFWDASGPARAVLNRAEGLLGPGFLERIFHGSNEELRDTRLTQPALVAVELALVAHLDAAGIRPDTVAGHSVGELSALAAAGVVTAEDAIRLADERGRAMSEDAPAGGMAAVMGMTPEAIELVLPPGVEIANYNGPAQTVISGTADALETVRETLEQCGARKLVMLNVSGPFHCSLMRKAADSFRRAMAGVPMAPPRCAFVSSVTGREESDPERIRELLGRQIESPVRWTDVMNRLGPCEALETGPGTVLQGIARRIDGAPPVQAAGKFADVEAWIGSRAGKPA
jgi:[acyl-carrier-protein] S-malonyltransferase